MKIIIDTREQHPLSFSWYNAETVSRKLGTGDYSIEGFENEVTIDRKGCISELYTNFFRDYKRFQKELIRMQSFKVAVIMCEFPYDHVTTFPNGVRGVNTKKLFYTADHLIAKINHISDKYNVKFEFVDNRDNAADRIYSILSEFYKNGSKS